MDKSCNIIPLEIWELILKYIENDIDLARFSAVCKCFFDLTRQQNKYLFRALGFYYVPENASHFFEQMKEGILNQQRNVKLHFPFHNSYANDPKIPLLSFPFYDRIHMEFYETAMYSLKYMPPESTAVLHVDQSYKSSYSGMVVEAMRDTKIRNVTIDLEVCLDNQLLYRSLNSFINYFPFTNITSLKIYFPRIGSDIQLNELYGKLIRLKQIKKLYLVMDAKCHSAVKSLCKSIQESNITSLYIKAITGDCTSFINFLKILHKTKVESLRVENLRFKYKHLRKWSECFRKCKNLRKMVFRHCDFSMSFEKKNPRVVSSFFEALQNSNIDWFGFSDVIVPEFDNDGFIENPCSKNITTLDFSHCYLYTFAIYVLCNIKQSQIKNIVLKNVDIIRFSGALVYCLQNVPLYTLNLSQTLLDRFEKEIFEAVINSSLKCLILRDCLLESSSVEGLCNIIKKSQLRKLDLSGNRLNQIDIRALENAKKQSGLEVLDLRFQKPTEIVLIINC